MIAPKVIVASAAVTLKFAVAVVPPCISVLDERVSLGVQHEVIEQAEDVEDRNQADGVRAEDEEEEGEEQRRPGVDPLLARRWAATMASRMNSTIASSAFMKPDGIGRSCFR